MSLLTTAEAAASLGYAVQTLVNWRYLGIGPKPTPLGRTIRYDQRDLDAWVKTQKGAA